MRNAAKTVVLSLCMSAYCVTLAMAQTTTSSSGRVVGATLADSRVPEFKTFKSLGEPATGFAFQITNRQIEETAKTDTALAFVMANIKRSAPRGFTGSGGGMGYLPTSIGDIVRYANSTDPDQTTSRVQTPTEWRYSTKFDAKLSVQEINVMIRDISRETRQPLDGTARVYTLLASGPNSSLSLELAR
jgi:hypothetical protein